MSAVGTYPGVYIQELTSGVHTITGVATSIAAFAGWAVKGPTNRATLVLSFSDFQSQFGGLDSRSYLGYAVDQFFANGGQQAYIVRVVWNSAFTPSAGTTPVAAATASCLSIFATLYANSPGFWGNGLTVSVIPTGAGKFQLQVLLNGVVVENFYNLSTTSTDPEFVVAVIDNDSQYVSFINPDNPASVAPTTFGAVTAVTGASFGGGNDGSVLAPSDGVNGDGNFEVAIGSDPTAVGNTFGIHLLDRVDIFNLLCVPGEADEVTISNLQGYCSKHRAFHIIDCPRTATYAQLQNNGPFGLPSTAALSAAQAGADYSAYYFPWVLAPDSQLGNRPRFFPPSGFVAGTYAAMDASRGVWKAPAGIDTSLTGVLGLQYVLTNDENGKLNPQGVNCLRQFKVYGNVVWGARTVAGNDQVGSQWKYVPIRRLALFIESSLYDGTQWVVFEPNDEPLWSQIRLNIGAFMQDLFLKGAFQGTTPKQAYFVKCDSENNPQFSIDQGIVNILVGFAPLYPAEFVVIQIQQMAGQLLT